MRRPAITVAEAKQQLDEMIARRLETRRELCSVAVSAAVPQADAIAAAVAAGGRPWWPELAPLTTGERRAVYEAVTAGVAGNRSANNVD